MEAETSSETLCISVHFRKGAVTSIICLKPCEWRQHDVLINIILNSERQHNYFITQGSYIGYMFRL